VNTAGDNQASTVPSPRRSRGKPWRVAEVYFRPRPAGGRGPGSNRRMPEGGGGRSEGNHRHESPCGGWRHWAPEGWSAPGSV